MRPHFLKKRWNRILIGMFFLFLLSNGPLLGQTVFPVKFMNQADVKVFEVEFENQADLNVYRVDYRNRVEGCAGNWFFTQFENQASKKIYFVAFPNQADLKIFYVNFSNRAGWRNEEKKKLICN